MRAQKRRRERRRRMEEEDWRRMERLQHAERQLIAFLEKRGGLDHQNDDH